MAADDQSELMFNLLQKISCSVLVFENVAKKSDIRSCRNVDQDNYDDDENQLKFTLVDDMGL